MLFLEDTQATIVSLGRDCQQARVLARGTEVGTGWDCGGAVGGARIGRWGRHRGGGSPGYLSTLPAGVATEEFPELLMCWAG